MSTVSTDDERMTDAVGVAADVVVTALSGPPAHRSREEWLAIVGACQSLLNSATAVQDAAIAEVARRENVWTEDGTLGETVHAPGRVAIDAADLVAPAIGASHAQSQRRVEQAVRVAAGRVPVEVDDADRPGRSGLGGLHAAMVAGRLDGYRAGVVAEELELAPAHVADAVVSALDGHLDAHAATLRRRTRQLVARIAPDLLRQRAKRARASTGLRRWVAEPGVDEWHGTFPSEDAATAWPAIDRLAHDLVAAGTCTSIEQARGKALTDLVSRSATVEVQVVLTVPADEHTRGPVAAEPTEEERTAPATTASGCDPATTDPQMAATDVPAATHSTVDLAPATVAADTAAACLPSIGGHDEDLVEVQGARPSEPLLVRRGWLRDHLPKMPSQPRRGVKSARPPFVPCDPLTGARLDPGDDLATDSYRPSRELAALVRARDGRCRFPGCSVAARFCDLDHVRPWPIGRTAARNLLALCRRHHRIKQRPGWHVHLARDGTTTWTDPTGRERTTAPLDALAALVLATEPEPPTTSRRRSTDPPPSTLEGLLEVRVEHLTAVVETWEHERALPPTHRRCTSAAQLRAALTRRRLAGADPERRLRAHRPGIPPF